MTIQDIPVVSLPRIQPPFLGTETMYILDRNGLDAKVLLSDVMGIGVRQVTNSGSADAPQFAIMTNNGAGQMKLADNTAQATAQAVCIALAAIAMGSRGLVQFNGYVAGLSGLTPGPVWLGTAGGLVFAPPLTPGSFQCKVGTAISATELIFDPQAPLGPQ